LGFLEPLFVALRLDYFSCFELNRVLPSPTVRRQAKNGIVLSKFIVFQVNSCDILQVVRFFTLVPKTDPIDF
jgi:hypothetical protein